MARAASSSFPEAQKCNDDTKCPASYVKVTWLYHIADTTTKANVKTVLG
jgi:hypothetical protein